jgi:acetyltransferase-like isoleucine patch superfamily enzyme
MKKLFFSLAGWIVNFIIRIVNKIQRQVLLLKFLQVGKNFIFLPLGSRFSSGKITIGDNVFIGEFAWFAGKISIGNNVMFGQHASILAGNHIFAIQGKSPRFIQPSSPEQNDAPVIIEDEVWVGANVTILGNLTVGMGSVVGAGSVVLKDICPYTISAGNPCKPLRIIFNDQHLLAHLILLGYDETFAQGIITRRRDALRGIDIPVVDKTDEITEFSYLLP